MSGDCNRVGSVESSGAMGSSVDEFEVASDGKHLESSTIVIVSSHKRVNQLSEAKVKLGGVGVSARVACRRSAEGGSGVSTNPKWRSSRSGVHEPIC